MRGDLTTVNAGTDRGMGAVCMGESPLMNFVTPLLPFAT